MDRNKHPTELFLGTRKRNVFLFNLQTYFYRLSGLERMPITLDEVLLICTGKSLSEALIFVSTNPQYDNRLFIELQVQHIKIPNSNMEKTCCVQKLFLTFKTIFVHNMFSPCSAKRRASDKDLPVLS